MQNNITTNPGIYIHIPFCERKCVYCDFYSVTGPSYQDDFIQSLLSELEQKSSLCKNKTFDTVYIGGGTPSLLSIETLAMILEKIYTFYNISANAETTIEINPGTVDREKLSAYKKLGIQRLSIGIQSFIDEELRFLGRIHNAQQARESITAARAAGFDNISLDLIAALPRQSIESWSCNLKQALEYRPEHISAYTLIVEDGTPLHEKVLKEIVIPKQPDEEAGFFEKTMDTLSAYGYLHYEVSSYSKSAKYISRHNFKYWNHSGYLGFGPSAHSFWNKRRFKNVSSITQYIKMLSTGRTAEIFSETLDDKTLEFEFIFLGLRTFMGVELKHFKNRFDYDFIDRYEAIIKDLTLNGFAETVDGVFKLTKKGMMLSDEILPAFA